MFFLKDMKAGEEVALYVMERGDKIIDIKIVEVATNDSVCRKELQYVRAWPSRHGQIVCV